LIWPFNFKGDGLDVKFIKKLPNTKMKPKILGGAQLTTI